MRERVAWRSALVKSSPPYDPACQKVPDNDVRSGRSPHSAARQPRGSGSFAVNRPSPVLPDTAHPVRPSAPAADRLHYGLRRHNASERQRRGKAGLKYPPDVPRYAEIRSRRFRLPPSTAIETSESRARLALRRFRC